MSLTVELDKCWHAGDATCRSLAMHPDRVAHARQGVVMQWGRPTIGWSLVTHRRWIGPGREEVDQLGVAVRASFPWVHKNGLQRNNVWIGVGLGTPASPRLVIGSAEAWSSGACEPSRDPRVVAQALDAIGCYDRPKRYLQEKILQGYGTTPTMYDTHAASQVMQWDHMSKLTERDGQAWRAIYETPAGHPVLTFACELAEFPDRRDWVRTLFAALGSEWQACMRG